MLETVINDEHLPMGKPLANQTTVIMERAVVLRRLLVVNWETVLTVMMTVAAVAMSSVRGRFGRSPHGAVVTMPHPRQRMQASVS